MKIQVSVSILLLVGLIVGCARDEDDKQLTTPDGTPVSTEYVADPPGTVIVNMVQGERYFRSYDNYWNEVFYLAFGDDYNFYGGGSYFDGINSVGIVTGLGAITKIPSGMVWADKVAAIPGYGYIVRMNQNGAVSYMRIYVVDYMTSGQYSGVTIKYEVPWTPQQ